jgi:aldose sugar dehydrogenase
MMWSEDRPDRLGTASFVGWHLLAAAVLLIAPLSVLLGESVWAIGPERVPVVVGLPIAYLLTVGLLRRGGRPAPTAARALVTLTLIMTPLLLVLLMVPSAWYSRRLLLAGIVLAAIFLTAPLLLSRLLIATAAMTAGVTLVLSHTVFAERPIASAVEVAAEPARTVRQQEMASGRGPLEATFYAGYIPTASQGGGIARLGDAWLIATGDGELHRVEWTAAADSLRVTQLPFRVPLNRDEFAAAVPPGVQAALFRVAHVLVRPRGDSLQIVASHYYWHGDRSCFVLRLSTLNLSGSELQWSAGESTWQTLYETTPCLPIRKGGGRGTPFAGAQIGGRLAVLAPGSLLVTVGDLMFDGVNAPEVLAQNQNVDYGKVLVVRDDGTAERFSMGHRNPIGIHVDAANRIWITDNGPRGGDALHELVRGANYGWPYSTHGTEYSESIWPLEPPPGWSAVQVRPAAFAWVPSIVPSNLIEVRQGPIDAWRGDLLIGTLSHTGLYRVRREADRVVYVERIGLERRIRDLIEADDGAVLIWADGGEIIRIAPASTPGAVALFNECTSCHATAAGAPPGIGPNLHGVYGRPIAARPDFTYSPALRGLSGHWLAGELKAFLADPHAFAPGTSKSMRPISDPEERAALVAYLEGLR